MRNFIIDCEVVAWDRVEKKILPFQALSTRKKKSVTGEDVTVQVCLFGFDLLYLNSVSYMNEPLSVRRHLLRSHFHPVDGLFMFATHLDTADPGEIEKFMFAAIKDSCEGLMVKGLEVDAAYVPNKRNWFKLKKDYMEGLADTLDLVVIGGWHGTGKRTGGYGGFLMATYDEETEDYQSICAIGTGLTDQDLRKFSVGYVRPTRDGHVAPAAAAAADGDGDSEVEPYFKVLSAPPRYYKYASNNPPDVWFEPTRVFEIKCADLSISPAHHAAMDKVAPGKGIALRFPRLKCERTDKSVPDDLTSATQVVHLFEQQSVQGGAGAKPKGRPGGGR